MPACLTLCCPLATSPFQPLYLLTSYSRGLPQVRRGLLSNLQICAFASSWRQKCASRDNIIPAHYVCSHGRSVVKLHNQVKSEVLRLHLGAGGDENMTTMKIKWSGSAACAPSSFHGQVEEDGEGAMDACDLHKFRKHRARVSGGKGDDC